MGSSNHNVMLDITVVDTDVPLYHLCFIGFSVVSCALCV